MTLFKAANDAQDSSRSPTPIAGSVASSSVATTQTDRRTEAASNPATAGCHVYHLSDRNALAIELGRRLDANGYEVEQVETIEELFQLLAGVPPQLVLIDASRLSDLAAVVTACREAQQRSQNQQRIRLVAMAARDNVQTRLDARRAGADVLLYPPYSAAEIVRRLQMLLTPAVEENVRVLIVEDDAAQALFAQGVLTNAGMQAQVQPDPMRVLESLDALQPDLILMDLHMPRANGVELTELIREHSTFTHLPIVFLSGECSPDARFQAINSGGDDFLSKPIRPKDLIAAVQNRVRRMRTMRHQALFGEPDSATGLQRRAFVLDRINDALATSSDQRTTAGGVLFLEISDTKTLRDRLGFAAVDELLVAAGRVLATAIDGPLMAASIHGNAFLILATNVEESALDALAERLRDRLMQHPFEAGGEAIRLSATVGICPVHFGLGNASALLNCAERACREARTDERGIKRYQPAKNAEHSQESPLIERLREAIRSDSFELIYQPITAVQGSHEAQYQTLLRMRDAGGELLPAAEILPHAERAGLVTDIDRWVLNRAMRVLRQQRDNGRDIRLFVPQSMATMTAIDQGSWLKAALAEHELPGSALVLESRFEDALRDPSALVAVANAMREDDVQMCLGQYEHTADADHLLDQVPLGYIKLASKYVASNASRIVRDEMRMLIERAHKFYIQVVGHRVEDASVAATLWMSGIDYIQGNLVRGAADTLDFDFNSAVL